MSSFQLTACAPLVNATYISAAHCLTASGLRTSPTYALQLHIKCPKIAFNTSSYQRCTTVCMLGGKGKSGNGNEYMYIINGEEMTRLATDYLKYIFWRKKSVRLRRSMYKWRRFYRHLTRKDVLQEDWLEREILNTPTWWHNPDQLRQLLRARLASTSYP
uniref:Uncharacterized protein n=1 Tax=Nelumbo nucifera TaxID=4432 RepID=A0A822Y206_NELNU|nr:TPA_asm: hypothetical protein HUJ06_026770 [Nelumbo nucifera]